MKAGTRTIRTSVASTTTANVKPNPNKRITWAWEAIKLPVLAAQVGTGRRRGGPCRGHVRGVG
jgi:hypothetical protein